MTTLDHGERDAEDLAAVVAVMTALARAHPPGALPASAGGWGAPVLREPLPAPGAGAWWQSGLPR